MRKKMLGYIAASIAFFMTVPSVASAAGKNDILMRGDKNGSVMELQQVLKQKGYFDSDITGYFGNETQQAVVDYQKKNGLTADGKVGPETGKHIFSDDYTTLMASLTSLQEGPLALMPGDSGNTVILLQKRLDSLEYYDYVTITGYYGPITQDSVRKFQQDAGLKVDGIADEKTLSALFDDSAAPYTMSAGDKGSSVQKLQDRLKALGYFNSDSTGYYGEMTVLAVDEFQKQNGLSVDGKAGKETRSLLFSNDASLFPGGDDPSPTVDPLVIQSSSKIINTAVNLAYSLLGKDYIYGASGPNSFDCSGLIYYILSNAGLAVNKMSPAAFANIDGWQTISNIESLEIGDIVFFKSDTANNINHMGMYVGGGSFIHASQSLGSVASSTMTNGYYNNNFLFAKRFS